MARNPNTYGTMTLVDNSGEKSSILLNVTSYNVLTFAGVLSNFDDLLAAIDAVSLCTKVHDSIVAYSTKSSAALPTNQYAARERKMVIRFEDTVNLTIGKIEIPGPDHGAAVAPLIAGTDKIDLTAAGMAALITEMEETMRSSDGNSINVLDATVVGRNL